VQQLHLPSESREASSAAPDWLIGFKIPVHVSVGLRQALLLLLHSTRHPHPLPCRVLYHYSEGQQVQINWEKTPVSKCLETA